MLDNIGVVESREELKSLKLLQNNDLKSWTAGTEIVAELIPKGLGTLQNY